MPPLKENDTLAAALAWAQRGHPVFPCWWPVTLNGQTVCACGQQCGLEAAKHPYHFIPHRDAMLETDLIKNWFAHLPEANLAVRTNKLVVLDVDPRHGGNESLLKLEAEHGAMPLTWRTLTGGGGTH